MSEGVFSKVKKATQRITKKVKEIADQLEFELVKFRGDSGEIDFNIDITKETVWATQQQIAELFGIDRSVVAKHIKNILDEGELAAEATCADFAQVRTEGSREVKREIEHYNLDMILSIGYRVSSTKATKFRQWANQTLKAYLVDGYALNERRLANDPKALRSLAAEVRALRSNEVQIYHAVRECFKMSAVDYDPNAQETRTFYATLQDKFLFAITEKTAAQLVLDRADSDKPNMGLTTFEGSFPTLKDVKVGKNYLVTKELYTLHILCEQFLLYAESKAIRGQEMSMRHLLKKLDELLRTNEYPVFSGYREYIKEQALEHARVELETYKAKARRGELLPAAPEPALPELPNRQFR